MPGVVIDAPGEGPIDADVVTGRDLDGMAVLFRTGWSRHFATERYGDASHPCLTAAAADALVAATPALVGIDSVNIDLTNNGERPVHTALLAAGIYIVEHLHEPRPTAGRTVLLHRRPAGGGGHGHLPGTCLRHDLSATSPLASPRVKGRT